MHRWLALLAFVTVAHADELGAERIPLRIAVGEVREIEVGYARMHVCDDPSIVDAEMRDKTAETNVFVIKGKKPGTTDCRVGLDPEQGRPTFLYAVTVEKAPTPKPPSKKR